MSFKEYKRHGITKETTENILIDAGAVYLNFNEEDERILGATREGNSFSIEQEVRHMEFDGARGPLKGGTRVIETIATLTANIIELTVDNIQVAIAGSEAEAYENGETHTKITRNRQILDSDYIKNVALVGTITGTDEPIICIVENALATSGFELTTTDKDETGLEITFTGHFDPASLDEEPWEIIYPEAVPENPEG